MHRQVAVVANRLSLRLPQRRSLEILDDICQRVPPRRGTDAVGALAAIRDAHPTVTDFERDFPSLCFALATGVGKTRLMGAFISYLHTVHGIRNFFVLAPNLTIYNKLITDFTPNTPKYVFTGIAEFATEAPTVITGDTYEALAGPLLDQASACKVNIFNISKINTEVRGGHAPRIKRLSEYIGQSYFDYLASLPDLVLLMDESHRYRASAGVRAINELKPVLGLELTATPFVSGTDKAKPAPFKNVVFDYPLAKAITDGFVKTPAVVTRRDFSDRGMTPEAVEKLKLEDGVALHEVIKVELATHARSTGSRVVKPFVLVIARDTTHAAALRALIQSDDFFEGRYRDKVIQVDSSGSSVERDENIERLLKVEDADEPTEIVIHVEKLKEGWDVTNLYTIVPLRAANARTLVEQSIGRGLRLPYGRRTGVDAVDRLNIVAHDKFQEIVDDARRPDSPLALQTLILGEDELGEKVKTVVVEPSVSSALGLTPPAADLPGAPPAAPPRAPLTPAEREVAHAAVKAIAALAAQPGQVPVIERLRSPEVQAAIVARVQEQQPMGQLPLDGVAEPPVNVAAVVARTVDVVVTGTIGIPRILVVPKALRRGFKKFTPDFRAMHFQPIADELWIQHLSGTKFDVVSVRAGVSERRLEDYVVSGLVDFSDVNYDDPAQAVLVNDLARDVVTHLTSYLSDEQAMRVLQVHQKDIARFIYAQMREHYWEEHDGYDIDVRRGFEELRGSAYTVPVGEVVRDARDAPADKSRIARYLFGGFARCLYPAQKFQSDTERVMALVLDRDALRWFKPAKDQIRIEYRVGHEVRPYVPDFIAETTDEFLIVETKARAELTSPEVIEKARVAKEWSGHATEHSRAHGSKPWRYALVPHDIVAQNMTLSALVKQ